MRRVGAQAAGLVPLLLLLLAALDSISAQPLPVRRPAAYKGKRGSYPDPRAYDKHHEDPRRYYGYGHDYGHKHKEPREQRQAPKLASDVAFTVNTCTSGLPGVMPQTPNPPTGVPLTSSVVSWFNLQCTPIPPPDPRDYGGYGSYDEYDGYGGYDGYDYDRPYGRPYNSSAYNHTRPGHKHRGDGYYGRGRRLQQAPAAVNAGQCWLWGITDVGIEFDANSTSTLKYEASVSITCYVGGPKASKDAVLCDPGLATADGSSILTSPVIFSGQGRVEVEYALSGGKRTFAVTQAPGLPFVITALYNGPAQSSTTTQSSLPLFRYNTGVAFLDVSQCHSTAPVANGDKDEELKDYGAGGGSLLVKFTT